MANESDLWFDDYNEMKYKYCRDWQKTNLWADNTASYNAYKIMVRIDFIFDPYSTEYARQAF